MSIEQHSAATPDRGPSEAAKQHAIEHASEIEARKERIDGWKQRRTEVLAQITKLESEVGEGVQTALKPENEGAMQLGIELRRATKAEISKLQIELSDLETKIVGAGGELEEGSLDFSTIQ